MKGLVYHGPRDVQVTNVDDPTIEKETDALVKITTTNICGSDLHMYEGRTSVEKGKVLGHENLGRVVAVGKAVDRVKMGDWVCLPFNTACGFCKNCERGLTSACLTTNPGSSGAAVARDGARRCSASESVVILYGSGPDALFAAYSAVIKGASQVMIVDRHRERFRLAESIGAIPIDDSRQDPVDVVMKLTEGDGAYKGCECVGWQAHDPAGRQVVEASGVRPLH